MTGYKIKEENRMNNGSFLLINLLTVRHDGPSFTVLNKVLRAIHVYDMIRIVVVYKMMNLQELQTDFKNKFEKRRRRCCERIGLIKQEFLRCSNFFDRMSFHVNS